MQGAALKPTAARYNKLDKQWYSASVPSSPDGKTSFTADWVTLAAGANGWARAAVQRPGSTSTGAASQRRQVHSPSPDALRVIPCSVCA